MKKPKYDVFISYRREGGYETALPIVEKLKAAGYRVFFDLESLNSGKFNEQLYDVIDGSTDFILVIPKGGLDRCNDPEDWVRKEVERALQKKKNIIPVMLKGFEWPENLPESLKELPVYQGVSATTPEYFDLMIERLSGYMNSKRLKPLRKIALIGGLTLAILIVLSVLGWLGIRQLAKPVATEAGSRLTLFMDIVHRMAGVQEDFHDSWELYTTQREKSNPGMRVYLDSCMTHEIEKRYIPELLSVANTFPKFPPLSNYERFMLGIYNTDPADVQTLPELIEGMASEWADELDVYIQTIEQNNFNTSSLNNLTQGYKADKNLLNSMYYDYLAFLASLPECAKISHREASKSWHLYPTVSESLNAEEYQDLSRKEMHKAEKNIEPMQAYVNMLSNKLNKSEEIFNDISSDILKQSPPTEVSQEITEKLDRISKQKKEISALQQELDEKEKEIILSYQRFKEKFRIDGSEDQYMQWGKIVRSAEFLSTTVNNNEKRVLAGMTPIVTDEEVLAYVLEQLCMYRSNFPETAQYVDGVKLFYKGVAERKWRPEGLVIMGTQNNLTHPLFKIGDILIERNGENGFRTMEEYRRLAKEVTPGTVSFLRVENGTLQKISCEAVETDVNIGLLPLF